MDEFIEVFKEIIIEGRYSSTYKVAWAKAIVELANENDYSNTENVKITLEEIAYKFLKYYWNQIIFTDFNQIRILEKQSTINSYVEELIDFFYKDSNLYSKFEEEEQSIKESIPSELSNCINNIIKALKQNVSWRFINLNGIKHTEIYEYEQNADYLIIKSKNLKILKDNYQDLVTLIDYRWANILNDFKQKPENKDKILTYFDNPKKSIYNNIEKFIELSENNLSNRTELIKLKSEIKNFDFKFSVKILLEVYQNIIYNEEKEENINFLKIIYNNLKDFYNTDEIINKLRNKISKNKLIGNDLIELIYNHKYFYDFINLCSQIELNRTLRRNRTSINLVNTDIIFLSLTAIAINEYTEGRFYPYIEDNYKYLFNKYSMAQVSGKIRDVADFYKLKIDKSNNSSRDINVYIRSAIVPRKYLPAFFTFIFDIYELNFKHEIVEETLEDDFKIIFDGLKNVAYGDSDQLDVNITNTKKVYTLIKTTKDIIKDDSIQEAIIKLSIKIIKIINQYYWSEGNIELNDYYEYGLNEWKKNFENKIKIKSTKLEKEKRGVVNRNPIYFMVNGQIYLKLPQRLFSNKYDYQDINILVTNGDEIIYNGHPEIITEIVGGYRIDSQDLLIKNPIGILHYQLTCGNEVLYNSDVGLYRNYLFFADSEKEIMPNTYYDGVIRIVTNESIEDAEKVFENDNYKIYEKYVNNDTLLKINGKIVTFSKFEELKPIGEIYDNTYISNSIVNINVYKNVNKILFSYKGELDVLGLQINNKRYKLEELNISKQGDYYIIYDLDLTESGLYQLEIFEKETGKSIDKGSTQFVIDQHLEYEIINKDDYNYILTISSDLKISSNKFRFNLNDLNDFRIAVNVNNNLFNYSLPLDIKIFSINDKWTNFNDYIWCDDIKQDTILKIKGIKFNRAALFDGYVNKILEIHDISTNKKENEIDIPISFISTYKRDFELLTIALYDNNELVEDIMCLNICKFDTANSRIYYDQNEKTLQISLKYMGKANTIFKILAQDNRTLYERKIEYKNNKPFKLKKIKTKIPYKLVLEQESTDLFEENKLLWEESRTFYNYEDFSNRYYRITSVTYGIDEGLNKNLYSTFVEIFKYNKETNKYLGNIYYVNQNTGYRIKYNNINPVEIEFESNVDQDNQYASVYIVSNTKDGLLMDLANNKIKNANYDRYAPDIINCIIDVGRSRAINESNR